MNIYESYSYKIDWHVLTKGTWSWTQYRIGWETIGRIHRPKPRCGVTLAKVIINWPVQYVKHHLFFQNQISLYTACKHSWKYTINLKYYYIIYIHIHHLHKIQYNILSKKVFIQVNLRAHICDVRQSVTWSPGETWKSIAVLGGWASQK